MNARQDRIDAVRRQSSELENHVIDEYRRGGLNRRDFLRAASVVGMGVPLAGFIAGSASAATKKTTKKAAAPKRAALLRLGVQAPGSKIDPVIANNGGALLLLGLAGEYLAYSNDQLTLEPRVATSWTPNATGTEWTFKLRRGIKFHNGKALSAADVVASFDRLADPANKSNALSVFKGLLQKGGTTRVDDYTVKFTLDAPTGAFPYLVSSDNYNAIILPRDYAGNWESSFIGTGPWVLEKYVVDQGVTFKRNPTYWDPTRQANVERLVLTQFKDDNASLAQLQAGQIDGISFTRSVNAAAVANNPNFVVERAPGAGHLQVHLRSDKGPFADKRLRQALALTLDREAIVKGVLDGFGQLGNDSPMAPAYTTTDKTVAQRKKDIAKAKALLTEAGKPDGFEVTLTTWGRPDIKLLAQVVQASAKEAGITVKLDIPDDTGAAYYDDKRNPSWLNSDFGITEFGHRGVPNVYLSAAYMTGGVWNAAHYSNPALDAAAKSFLESPDIATQKSSSKKIQEILVEDSPVVTAYFAEAIQITKKNIAGLKTNGMSHIDTGKAVIS